MGVTTSAPPAGKTGYPGLDRFRIVAALLVVAVHTSPLLSVNEYADFLLTRVVARLAVPFFFICTGFFMLDGNGNARMGRFTRKNLAWYALATLLYLPLNLYMGYFSGLGAAGLLRDVLLEGTFYHLWYFPAVILGGWVAWLLYRKLPRGVAFALAGTLYLLGLGGDSYATLTQQIPGVGQAYAAYFGVTGYTRNGLFFAPLFILFGMTLRARPRPTRAGKYAAGLTAALLLMAAEASLLRWAAAPEGMRHDSMYLLLPLCSVLLFRLLQMPRGDNAPWLRQAALWVYLLHPWCIVLVRGAAKFAGLESLIVGVSPLFYLCVCVLSVAAGLLLAWLGAGLTPPDKTQRAWATIDLTAMGHNLSEMRALLPGGCTVTAVVKTNAYGMGAKQTARYLQRQGVRSFAVATLPEAIALRKAGIRGDILILGYTPAEAAPLLRFWRLTQTVVDYAHAAALEAQGKKIRVQIKIDTGLHRLGLPFDTPADVVAVYQMPHLRVTGIWSHFAVADSLAAQDIAFTRLQAGRFNGLLETLRKQGIQPGQTHLQSSYGVLNHPDIQCDTVRLGLALYGVHSRAGDTTRLTPTLRPVLSLHARVASVRTLAAGEQVGYGLTFTCPAPTRIATLAIGYADGVPRNITGAQVLLHGCKAPVVGRLSMDQLAVDITDIPGITPGDTATLIGTQQEESISAEEFAGWCGSITNEVLCRIGQRVPRAIKQSLDNRH